MPAGSGKGALSPSLLEKCTRQDSLHLQHCCHETRSTAQNIHLWPELRPTPRWGNFEHSRDPQAGFKEPFRGGEVRARWRGKQGSGARKDRDRKERERIG